MSVPSNLEGQSVEGLFKILNKKWTILTVIAVGNLRRVRFNDLRRELTGISPKTLIETLRDLERIGVVNSEQFMEIPPKVEYFLTAQGESFRKSLMPVVRWVVDQSDNVDSNILSTALESFEE